LAENFTPTEASGPSTPVLIKNLNTPGVWRVEIFLNMSANIIFITGSSAVGKTPLVASLKKVLPDSFIVHDLDEKLPEANRTENNWLHKWRNKTTKFFLDEAVKNAGLNKSTIISGLTFPSEIYKLADSNIAKKIKILLLDANNEALRDRFLTGRFSNQNNVAALKKDTGLTPEELIEKNKRDIDRLKKECVEHNAKIIDTSDLKTDEVASQIKNWLLAE